ITSNEARSRARECDEIIAQTKDPRELPFLIGIPGSLKDVFCTKGIRTTGASNIIRDYFPPYSASSALKLEESGYVLIGKTNLDEFTMGASTENSAFGVVKNPFDSSLVAGGSSGGSACAVQTGQGFFSLGTDTGGSIRQPAAFCGVVGLKPTYGLVSRYGVMSMASSLDTVAPVAKTVEDVSIVLEAVAGGDLHDSTTSHKKIPSYSKSINESLGELTIGIPEEFLREGMDEEVIQGFERAKELLESLGVKLKSVSLPHSVYSLAAYYVIVPAEVSSNLARYDGIRFGNKIEASTIEDHYLFTRGQGFGIEAKRRIMIGTFVLSKGYYEAYYGHAERVRTLIKHDLEEVLKKVDFILSPVSPFLPFKIGEKIDDPLKMYLADIFTVSVNLAGIPALSIPIKFAGKFPVSVQIMGPQFSEELLLRLGHHLEQARGPIYN
ncbi:Asp-tRNA(Asn)/Glu-tRNA(Gln) amidotransferase subunit GatA, partial [Candidatus Falkowbacteria bacterium]|nr:Asp-tRNA(Asn)/Glu-tRNA(Gln) amidotransferase subunit GatA [Candidatus Falkowbacteria bacterium]